MRGAMRGRRALRSLFQVVLFLFDSVLLRVLRPRIGEDGKKLILIRADGLGDFILFLPLARLIIADWQKRRGGAVVLVVNGACRDLAKALDGVEQVIALDRHRFRINPYHRARFLLEIIRLRADTVIEAAYSRDASLGDAIVRFSGAVHRLGWAGNCCNTSAFLKRFTDRSYSRLFAKVQGPINEIQIYEALADQLGLMPQAPVPSFDVLLPPEPLEGVPVDYYVLAPQAGAGLRQWPSERFAVIAERIYKQSGLTVVLVGDGRKREIAAAIRGQAQVPLIDLDGQIGLRQLARLIAGARFVVGNDSAPVHLAALFGIGSVVVLAGGQFGRFHPYGKSALYLYRSPVTAYHEMTCFGCDWICPFVGSPHQVAPCIDRVSIDDVWSLLLDLPEMPGGKEEWRT